MLPARRPHLADHLDALILAAWSVVALASWVGCALAARHGLLAIDVPPSVLRFAAACAAVVAAAMAGIALLTLIYLFDLVAAATPLASAPNGPFGNPDVRVSLVLQLLAMVAFAVPAAVGAVRARRAFAG